VAEPRYKVIAPGSDGYPWWRIVDTAKLGLTQPMVGIYKDTPDAEALAHMLCAFLNAKESQ